MRLILLKSVSVINILDKCIILIPSSNNLLPGDNVDKNPITQTNTKSVEQRVTFSNNSERVKKVIDIQNTNTKHDVQNTNLYHKHSSKKTITFNFSPPKNSSTF